MICQRAEQAAAPIEVFCGDIQSNLAQIIRQFVRVGINGEKSVKRCGPEADPFDRFDAFRNACADLAYGSNACPVDSDRAVHPALSGVTVGVGVVRRSLIVRGKQIFHIFYGYFSVRDKGPGDVIALRGKLCIFAVPAMRSRGKIPAHKPCPGSVVNMIHISAGSEDISRVEFSSLVEVKMVFGDEVPQIFGAEVFFSCSESVFKVKSVHPELIRHQHTTVVRYTSGYPVMAADGFHPPDFMFIIKSNPVGFVSSVLLQQRSQAKDPFPGTMDVRQDEDNDILFSDSAGNIFFPAAFRFLVFLQRIGGKHTGIGSNGFRCRHADVCLIDAGCCPDTVFPVHTRACGIPHRVIGQFHLQMGKDAFIFFRLPFRRYDDHFLDIEVSVIGSCDHGRSVVAGTFAD